MKPPVFCSRPWRNNCHDYFVELYVVYHLEQCLLTGMGAHSIIIVLWEVLIGAEDGNLGGKKYPWHQPFVSSFPVDPTAFFALNLLFKCNTKMIFWQVPSPKESSRSSSFPGGYKKEDTPLLTHLLFLRLLEISCLPFPWPHIPLTFASRSPAFH